MPLSFEPRTARTPAISLALVLMLAGASGCAKHAPAAKVAASVTRAPVAPATSANSVTFEAMSLGGASEHEDESEHATDRPRTPLSDVEIASLVDQINMAQLLDARLALSRAHAPAVKRIASLVSNAHSRASERNVVVFRGLRGDRVQTIATSRLAEEQAQSRAVLAQQTGADFDLFYVDILGLVQQRNLDLIDHVFLPQAEDAALRASLEELRDGIGHQLREIERVRVALTPT